jgi:hypothetical protein
LETAHHFTKSQNIEEDSHVSLFLLRTESTVKQSEQIAGKGQRYSSSQSSSNACRNPMLPAGSLNRTGLADFVPFEKWGLRRKKYRANRACWATPGAARWAVASRTDVKGIFLAVGQTARVEFSAGGGGGICMTDCDISARDTQCLPRQSARTQHQRIVFRGTKQHIDARNLTTQRQELLFHLGC